MEQIAFTGPQTKPCPFCAETIQQAAIKCRFCGEFLNSEKARALEEGFAAGGDSSATEEEEETILFAGRPSLFGIAGALLKGALFLVVAGLLLKYPVEDWVAGAAENIFGYQVSDSRYYALGGYKIVTAAALAILVFLVLGLKFVKLKMTYYEVSAERIEWSRGIFDRKVDNLDMFRVVDLSLRRTLPDCIFGIGTVGLVTTDKTDPDFTFEKMRHCRSLYDIIKSASLQADRRNNVVHLE